MIALVVSSPRSWVASQIEELGPFHSALRPTEELSARRLRLSARLRRLGTSAGELQSDFSAGLAIGVNVVKKSENIENVVNVRDRQ